MTFRKAVRRINIFRSATAPPQQTLQTRLEDAKRAEKDWRTSTYFEVGVEYPHLHSLCDSQIDGLWVCHCGHENQLIHYTGDHPFKILTCGRCDHTFCDQCQTSEILTRIPTNPTEVYNERFHIHSEMPYCIVCETCGLSHRAKMMGGCIDFSIDRCACGNPVEGDKFGYFIGSVYEYRKDPEGTAVMLSLRRHHTAASEAPNACESHNVAGPMPAATVKPKGLHVNVPLVTPRPQRPPRPPIEVERRPSEISPFLRPVLQPRATVFSDGVITRRPVQLNPPVSDLPWYESSFPRTWFDAY
jgi:hypothetical protein